MCIRDSPRGIILREKDLPEAEYLELARQTAEICDRYQTPCVLHSFPGAALELGVKQIHLPLPILRNLSPDERAYFTVLGASCHSAEDAREAETLGCTYITAGHVFDTDCKKGLPGRGLEFLKQVCESVKTPVYAIGGIAPENYKEVMAAGAAGAVSYTHLVRKNPFDFKLNEVIEDDRTPRQALTEGIAGFITIRHFFLRRR